MLDMAAVQVCISIGQYVQPDGDDSKDRPVSLDYHSVNRINTVTCLAKRYRRALICFVS